MPQPGTTTSSLTADGRMDARIAVSGSSGFLGVALTQELERAGATVHRLVRGEPRRASDIRWDAERGLAQPGALEGMDAVVHLAGEPVAQRWTSASRERIRSSRVHGTTTLAKAIAALDRPPRVLLSGSAIGYYGAERGDEIVDEGSAPGTDFLADVAVQWEAAAESVRAAGVRLVLLRTGVVLGTEGGVLDRLLLPFRLGLGGRFGSGRQWMSWIALHDWVQAVRFALAEDDVRGPVNLVAPQAVTNDEFTKTVGFVLHRPTVIPVPAFALRAVFNEMADAVLVGGQRVQPAVLLNSGFRFRYPELEPALEATLRG